MIDFMPFRGAHTASRVFGFVPIYACYPWHPWRI